MDDNHCPDSGAPAGEKGRSGPAVEGGRKRGKPARYSAAAVILLVLLGALLWYGRKSAWDFSVYAPMGQPAAVVNGEPIPWSEARPRIATTRRLLEQQYGGDLFAGEQSRALLADLERDVLRQMADERLVAQEARRLNIRVSDDEALREMRRIGKEIYGSWETFQASLEADGISGEYLKDHIRTLLLSRAVQKAKASPGADPDRSFTDWLAQCRRSAAITFSGAGAVPASLAGRGSCCGAGGGGGGCGVKSTAGAPPEPGLGSRVSAAALAAYRKTHPAEKDVQVRVTDFGCHIQADIEENGQIVQSYTYRDGAVYEL